MSDTSFINQPFTGQAGAFLIEQLDNPDCIELKMAVAFAKTSGVYRLKQSIESFRRRGGKVTAYIGIDLDGTSYEALSSLYSFVDSLYVIHLEGDQTFHPKIYNLAFSDGSIALLGSHNLTLGGLWRNVESCAVIRLNKTNKSDVAAQTQLDDYFNLLASDSRCSKKIKSKADIDNLMADGYITTQPTIQRARKSRAATVGAKQERKSIFARGIPAYAPSVSNTAVSKHRSGSRAAVAPPKDNDAPQSHSIQNYAVLDELQTFWFESGRLTGGSRNQLDLSMKALVESGDPERTEFATDEPNMMKGGLYFFGLDAATAKKEGNYVTILYENQDFANNEIKLYGGKKANGTWRLNLKGVTAEGVTLLDCLGEKFPRADFPLQKKVLVFERIDTGYYALTIFEESDLQGFVDASVLVGRNGTSKLARLAGVY